MKKPFAVGDHVAFYESGSRRIGVISKDLGDGSFRVSDVIGEWLVHQKQCRRLKPRRRVWVRFATHPETGVKITNCSSTPIYDYGWTEFVEVKKK